MVTHVGTFVLLSALIAVVPGPDTAIVTRNALVGGRRAGLFTILGVAFGLSVWTLAAGGGIAALIRASEPAFVALKVAGAVYLAVLGGQALWGALRRQGPRALGPQGTRTISARSAVRGGAITNLGNPKIAVFFTSFLPQFTSGDHPSFAALVLLGVLFCSIGLGWLTLYSLVVSRLGDFLRRPRPRRVLEGFTGIVLIGFGLRLAAEHR
jgi:threonine/homoserine/homoserine lactone efflux protein